ncbi:hypothetical protein O6R05_04695 [Peptoniphilus equinus]|uniref:Phage protein n=1 Tax=Peptoniphilus equinus TaxID=3016343 RepID=A0ABY7QR97_9FIRM|nr:hypothetical protein [Peptoniphilus equinus]WBW49311.1 hypothetical protein O6R05_04695 [Peptoniphilus equinus]
MSQYTEEQRKYTKQWKRDNKEYNRLMSYRSTARLFARKYATKEDMEILGMLFKEKNPNAKES